MLDKMKALQTVFRPRIKPLDDGPPVEQVAP